MTDRCRGLSGGALLAGSWSGRTWGLGPGGGEGLGHTQRCDLRRPTGENALCPFEERWV